MPTPNAGIPYVPENTIDPAAGLNDSLRVIDALIQVSVLSMGSTAPPASPNNGDRHIVGAGATGAWAGRDLQMAQFVAEGGFWIFYEAGSQVSFIRFGSAIYLFDGEWVLVTEGGGSGSGYTIVTEASAFTATTGTHDGIATYTRAAGDVTFNSAQAYTTGMTFQIRATNTLALVGAGVTLTPPAGGTLLLESAMSVQIIMTSPTTADVIGQTVPA